MTKWTLIPHLALEKRNHNEATTEEIGLQQKVATTLTEVEAGGGLP